MLFLSIGRPHDQEREQPDRLERDENNENQENVTLNYCILGAFEIDCKSAVHLREHDH